MSPDLLVEASRASAIGGRTHTELVESLVKAVGCGEIVANALLAVDRRAFVADHECPRPYANERHSLGFNASMPTPQMHAQLLCAIAPALRAVAAGVCADTSTGASHDPSANTDAGAGAPSCFSMLDIGSGSGYPTIIGTKFW